MKNEDLGIETILQEGRVIMTVTHIPTGTHVRVEGIDGRQVRQDALYRLSLMLHASKGGPRGPELTDEDFEALRRLERYAWPSGGHFTIYRFSGNWRVFIGTPYASEVNECKIVNGKKDDSGLGWIPEGKTLAEAIDQAIAKDQSKVLYRPIDLVDHGIMTQGEGIDQERWRVYGPEPRR